MRERRLCVLAVLMLFVFWLERSDANVAINYWSTVTQCVGNGCSHFHDEDQNCRGRGGFEYADFTSCVLPNFWNVLSNCRFSSDNSSKCSSFPSKSCENLKGFLIANNTLCSVPANYTTLSSLSANFSSFPNCTFISGNTQMCLLKGNWTVLSNCFDGKCSSDLEEYCGEAGGFYYNNSFLSEDGFVVSEPSCALPFPAQSLYFCGSEFDSDSIGDLNCHTWTEDQCPGLVYNDGYSCLIEGNYTIIPEMADKDACQKQEGQYYNGSCILNGTWTLIDSTGGVNVSLCTNLSGVPYENGRGCALGGVWSVLFCQTTHPCAFPEDECMDIDGFLIDEGCVTPDRWTVLNECHPIDICEDNDCKWSQCRQVNGILYDNCTACAIPVRMRSYSSTLWKVLLAFVIAFAALILILNFSTKIILYCRRQFCRRVERY